MVQHPHHRSSRPERFKDEVYRQMFRLEEGYPSADLSLAVALIRAWIALERNSAGSEPRRWLRKISPMCLSMIEALCDTGACCELRKDRSRGRES